MNDGYWYWINYDDPDRPEMGTLSTTAEQEDESLGIWLTDVLDIIKRQSPNATGLKLMRRLLRISDEFVRELTLPDACPVRYSDDTS